MRGEDVPFYTTAAAATTFKTNVGIGSPPTFYTLIVDTGSANTWISARFAHSFKPTETSRKTNTSLCVKYGTGEFRGKLWHDRVTLGGLVIENQGIGVAERTKGFDDDVDGILGLGLVELTKESIVEDGEAEFESIPTVLDNLFTQGQIKQKTVAISFDRMVMALKAEDYAGKFYGTLTFGGIDPSKFTGELTYVPIPQDRSSSKHWSIEQKITYGSLPDEIEILKSGIGVIDTGSSVVHLEYDAFQVYRRVTNSYLDHHSGLLSLREDSKTRKKSLFFEIGGKIFEIPPEDQLWPRALNDVAGGPEDDSYLVYVEMCNDSGVEISLINGFTWLQHFFIVLDAENRRVGIANAVSKGNFIASIWPRLSILIPSFATITRGHVPLIMEKCFTFLCSLGSSFRYS